MIISPEEERSLIIKILNALGVSEEHAKITADVIVDADLKGFTSHGIGRFPQYVEGIKLGTIKTSGNIEIEKKQTLLH